MASSATALSTAAPTSLQAERVARALVLVVLYAAPALVCLHGAVIADGDLWWHLRAADWMLQSRHFPHTDPFSTFGLATAKPWAAYSWLFELVLLKLYQHIGLAGVLVYSTGMVLAITVALHRLIARLQQDFTLAVLLTLAAMISISPMYTPRPWLVTVLFFTLQMDLLLTVRRTGNPRPLLWLPLLFALWANIHIQWMDGLVTLGVAALEATIARWRPSPAIRLRAATLWLTLAACLLAVMVNPYGWRIYQVAWQLASQPGVMRYISELQAIPFRGFQDYLVLALALSAAATLGWQRRLPLFETGLLSIAAVVTFRSQRDIWLMAIVAAVILASGLRGEDSAAAGPELPSWLIVASALLATLVGGPAFKVDQPTLQTRLDTQMPVKAAAFIKAKGYRGPLYNTYDWGGYLMWTLRQPVSLDGRAALHGDQRIEQAIATWSGQPGWSTDPNLLSAGVVVAPVKLALAQLLRLDPRFTLVYEDAVAVVFIPR